MKLPLHVKYIENSVRLLRIKTAIKEADFIEKYINSFKEAVKSPDSDYPEFTFLRKFLPENIRKIMPRTSPIKFEHVLVDDVPKFAEGIFIKICERLSTKYRYADQTLIDWYELARIAYKQKNEIDMVRHLGRCCHLIQDICVPMHCKVIGNLRDVFDIFKCKDKNHSRYESYCDSIYNIECHDIDLTIPFIIPNTLQEIAKKSREYVQTCNNTKFTSIWSNILKFFNLIHENKEYRQAAEYTNKTAQTYTVNFLYHALQEFKLNENLIDL